MKNIITVISVILFTSFLQDKEIPMLGIQFNSNAKNDYTSAFACFNNEIYGATITDIVENGTIATQTNLYEKGVINAFFYTGLLKNYKYEEVETLIFEYLEDRIKKE